MKKYKFPERRKRQLLIFFLCSFVLSLALTLYVFGLENGFFLSWLRAFLLLFIMISATVLGIVPLLNFATSRLQRR